MSQSPASPDTPPGVSVVVIAYNTLEHWTEDVSASVAAEIQSRCDIEGQPVPEHVGDFVLIEDVLLKLFPVLVAPGEDVRHEAIEAGFRVIRCGADARARGDREQERCCDPEGAEP